MVTRMLLMPWRRLWRQLSNQNKIFKKNQCKEDSNCETAKTKATKKPQSEPLGRNAWMSGFFNETLDNARNEGYRFVRTHYKRVNNVLRV